MTRRNQIDINVKEYESGQPFLVIEWWSGDELPEVQGKLVAFDLKPGTSTNDALALKDQMRKLITHLTITD